MNSNRESTKMRKEIPKTPALAEVKKFIRKYVKDSEWNISYLRGGYTCSIPYGLHTRLHFYLKWPSQQLEIWYNKTLVYTLLGAGDFYHEILATSGRKEDIYRRNTQWIVNQMIEKENK